jgi:signal transduction histidine kinase
LETIAQQLLDGQDTDTELRYEEQQADILSDTLLWNLMDRPVVDKDRIVSGLREGYFDGFFDRYELSLEVFSKLDRLPDRYRFLPDSTPIGLFRPINPELGLSYVLQVNPPNSEKRAVVDFVLRIIPEELGFPELLIKEESVMEQELREYSIARYRDGHLMDRFGEYAYRLDIPTFIGRKDSEDKAFEQEDYWHYAFSRGTESYIISVRRKTFMGKVTTFTLAFSFISICLLLGMGIEALMFGRSLPRGDLQSRIQGLVIGVLFAALLVFGFGSYAYIVAQKQANSIGQLEEKVESVLIELSHKIEKENAMGNQALLQTYLVKFSKVFFTDINLYDLEGRLMASSRPEVFSRKLIAPLMPSEAFRQLHKESESRFVHEEHIGKLDFLSAYVPFTSSDGEVLAYLNLPYFAKQGELEAELATFLIAVVNVLLILFVFSILLAVTVSSWITRPLQLLKDNLAAIRLGAENKPIPYRGTDEIADLVREYNAKVAELQENAERLAQSERESAWREMAKQVAHEIKNPLTPMKLSLQYLQRSLDDRSDDWEERFERSTQMLIEQIDTLSGIATAFSDFAKMPQAAKEEFDLLSLVLQVVSLFQQSPDHHVGFHSDLTGPQRIHADRGQFTRLINNLLKNAIQSIPDDQEGRVEVSLMKKGHRYIIEVKDDGEGIPESMRDRIFQPNFTTKSTGTGLGLAMCKNIVHQAEGEIWFQTQEGQGTSFFVSLPVPDDSQ